MSVNHIPMRHELSGKSEMLPERYLDHPAFGRYLKPVHSTKPLNEVKSAKTLEAPKPQPPVFEYVSEDVDSEEGIE